MLNRKSGSCSLSYIMKVYKNFKSAMQSWRVTLPIDDIGDPSAVFSCIAVSRILDL